MENKIYFEENLNEFLKLEISSKLKYNLEKYKIVAVVNGAFSLCLAVLEKDFGFSSEMEIITDTKSAQGIELQSLFKEMKEIADLKYVFTYVPKDSFSEKIAHWLGLKFVEEKNGLKKYIYNQSLDF